MTRKNVPVERFVELVLEQAQNDGDLTAIAELTNRTIDSTYQRYAGLRRDGVSLPTLPRKRGASRGGKRLNVAALNALVERKCDELEKQADDAGDHTDTDSDSE